MNDLLNLGCFRKLRKFFLLFTSRNRVHEKNFALRTEKIFFKVQQYGFTFQPGDALYPKDENGKFIYHETDLCATWEVRKYNIHPYML